MNLLSWLLLGHFLGDWLFQSDWMAQGKRKGLITAAGMTHFTIYTLPVIGLLWLVNYRGITPTLLIGVGVVVFVSHWLIDATDCVGAWMRFFGQQDRPLMRIMVDQTFHFIVLCLIAVVFFGSVA